MSKGNLSTVSAKIESTGRLFVVHVEFQVWSLSIHLDNVWRSLWFIYPFSTVL